MKISHDMEQVPSNDFTVGKIDKYKVHDMRFKEQGGTSLPLVDCSKHSSAKMK